MKLVLVGMSYRTAGLAEREALAFDPASAADLLARVARGTVVGEGAILSTCNRTEFYAAATDVDGAQGWLREEVRRAKGRDLLAPGPHLYTHTGRSAATHLFRVASGLDSMVLGDSQILAQVKDAHVVARRAGSAGTVLVRLFETALHVGKRARAETGIGTGVTSVPAAAVELALEELGSLTERRAVVVGAGETGNLAAQHLVRHHVGALTIVNRGIERARAVAAKLGARAVPLTQLGDALADADLAICATQAPGTVVAAGLVGEIMASRPDRSLLLVDIAVPRDVEAAAAEVPGVTVHAIDAIEHVVDRSLEHRRQQAPRVEAIVAEDGDRFAGWLRSLAAAPVLRELRDHFERARMDELRRALKDAPPEERERAEQLTRALIDRLLRVPARRLRDSDPASDAGRLRLRAARELFELGEVATPHGAGRGA